MIFPAIMVAEFNTAVAPLAAAEAVLAADDKIGAFNRDTRVRRGALRQMAETRLTQIQQLRDAGGGTAQQQAVLALEVVVIHHAMLFEV